MKDLKNKRLEIMTMRKDYSEFLESELKEITAKVLNERINLEINGILDQIFKSGNNLNAKTGKTSEELAEKIKFLENQNKDLLNELEAEKEAHKKSNELNEKTNSLLSDTIVALETVGPVEEDQEDTRLKDELKKVKADLLKSDEKLKNTINESAEAVEELKRDLEASEKEKNKLSEKIKKLEFYVKQIEEGKIKAGTPKKVEEEENSETLEDISRDFLEPKKQEPVKKEKKVKKVEDVKADLKEAEQGEPAKEEDPEPVENVKEESKPAENTENKQSFMEMGNRKLAAYEAKKIRFNDFKNSYDNLPSLANPQLAKKYKALVMKLKDSYFDVNRILLNSVICEIAGIKKSMLLEISRELFDEDVIKKQGQYKNEKDVNLIFALYLHKTKIKSEDLNKKLNEKLEKTNFVYSDKNYLPFITE